MKTLIPIQMPNLTLFGLFFKKPILILISVPTTIVASNIISFEKTAWLLFWMFITDFITGIFASYCEWKKTDRKDRWFFGKGEGFSSKKAKGSVVKAVMYLAIPYFLLQLQHILMLKNFKYQRFSEAEFGISTACLLLFSLIEGFSIFHENLPKCGFNIWESIKKMIGFFKEVKKEI